MVDFSDSHKDEAANQFQPHTEPVIDWYNDDGGLGKIDLRQLEVGELWDLRNSISRFCDRQLAIIDEELNDWRPIYCAVCGEEDLAYRGQPFITWGLRGGHVLCPRHLRAYDRIGTPEAEILKQARQEAQEIKELFG